LLILNSEVFVYALLTILYGFFKKHTTKKAEKLSADDQAQQLELLEGPELC
jgi:hypothetical protein